MSQPVLKVSGQGGKTSEAQLHLLPCRIHHDGPVDPSQSYWSPSESQPGGTKTAYFRGRKLHGKVVKLPAGYYGAVVQKGESKRESSCAEEMDEETDIQEISEPVEIAPLDVKASFDDMLIWGHESMASAGADPYVRGMEEWVSFAEQMHSYPSCAGKK